MLKLFGFSPKHEDEDMNENGQPNLLAPATAIERKPPPQPQVRQSRLGTKYEASAQKKKPIPKNVSTVHKAKVPQTQSSRVSRLGSNFEDTSRPVRPPSNSSSYEEESLDDTTNPIVSFMLSCVSCDDDTDPPSIPVATDEKE